MPALASKLALLAVAAFLLGTAHAMTLPLKGFKKHEMRMYFVPADLRSHDATPDHPAGETWTSYGNVLARDLKTRMGNFTQVMTVVAVNPKAKIRIVMFDVIIELGRNHDDSIVVKGQFEVPEPWQGLQTFHDMDAVVVGGRGKVSSVHTHLVLQSSL